MIIICSKCGYKADTSVENNILKAIQDLIIFTCPECNSEGMIG